jgi:isopenicillin-N epimerase
MEADPVRFFVEEHQDATDAARKALAEFVRCPWDALAPVPNASIGVATVFANTQLAPGDEVLITGHEYPACQNSARRLAATFGARVVVASIPFPIDGPDAVVRAVEGALSPRTRIALLSHVTSPSGLVLPIETLVPMLEARGVRTLVDGAHAPGMLPSLDIARLDPSYYVANCHKWICSPKGSAFFYVRPDLQHAFRPLALSNNAEAPKPGRSQFLTEFDYVGTQDCTAFHAIPDAIRCMRALVPGGWPEIMRRNRDLAIAGRTVLCERLRVAPPAPEAMLGSIASIILPQESPQARARRSARPSAYADALQDRLLRTWRIQVPVWTAAVPGDAPPPRILRISAQLYNSIEQYEYLAHALASELDDERRV